jgi:hypothetical protein
MSNFGPGVSIDEIIECMNKCLNATDLNIVKSEVESIRSRVQHPEHSEMLGKILQAMSVPDILGNGGTVKDPSSGKPYPNTKSIIKGYMAQLHSEKKQPKTSNNNFNLLVYSQVEQKQKEKKKSRGNPFRVLMGKVGKLLDHGLERKDIVRYLLKDNIWNEKTIERAIKIVKEYNRKKKSKKTVEAQTLHKPSDNDNVFQKVNPDYKKRSTAELVTSICWLHTCATIDPNKVVFAKEVADRSGVKNMIREIKSELIRRGMSEKDLNSLLK